MGIEQAKKRTWMKRQVLAALLMAAVGAGCSEDTASGGKSGADLPGGEVAVGEVRVVLPEGQEGLRTSESGTTATFEVVLGTAPSAAVRVMVSSGDASEGAVRPETLTFGPEDWSVAQVVTVTGTSTTRCGWGRRRARMGSTS